MSEDDFFELQSDLVDKCRRANGHPPRSGAIYDTPSEYDPLSLNMGQLTVYRFKLKCKCNEDLLKEQVDGYERCGQFLSYEHQGWPSFMGIRGDSVFNMFTGAKKKPESGSGPSR